VSEFTEAMDVFFNGRSPGALTEAGRRIRELEAVLRQYTHCRHGCIDCFCTKEAKAALYSPPAAAPEHGR